LAIIIGLGVGALSLALLVLILLYVGGFLFLGEWLFGSMGWGIIHGSLLTTALIVLVGVNLAGGSARDYGTGFVVGLVIGLVAAVVLASNVLPQGATAVAGEAQRSVDLATNFLATMVGLLVGGAALALVGLIAGWRRGLRSRPLMGSGLAAFVVGAFVGSIVASSLWSYAGAAAIGVTLGLVAWIVAGLWLANRRGFEPEARYATLVPSASIAAFEKTRAFVLEQWQRQKGRMMGR
jgi:hypothetical protein